MDRMIFNHAIPRVRVFESKLLEQATFERMIRASSAEKAIDLLLQEVEYAPFADEIDRPEDYETLLNSELQRIYKVFYDMTPVKEVVDVMTLKYDYHNLKVLVKEKILQRDFSHMLVPIGTIELAALRSIFKNGEYRDLRPHMREAVETVLADFEEKNDPQRIGILFDQYMFQEKVKLAEHVGGTFLPKYVKAKIDLANLESFLRIKLQKKGRDFLHAIFIEGGNIEEYKFIELLTDSIENMPNKLFATDYAKMLRVAVEDYVQTDSLNLFNKLSDNYLMDMMKAEKVVTFGLEPLIGYLYAKETEIQTIRMIMVGKLNQISAENIRERLRDSYA